MKTIVLAVLATAALQVTAPAEATFETSELILVTANPQAADGSTLEVSAQQLKANAGMVVLDESPPSEDTRFVFVFTSAEGESVTCTDGDSPMIVNETREVVTVTSTLCEVDLTWTAEGVPDVRAEPLVDDDGTPAGIQVTSVRPATLTGKARDMTIEPSATMLSPTLVRVKEKANRTK